MQLSTLQTSPPLASTLPVLPLVDERLCDTLPYDDFVRDYVRMNRPVVVRGAAADWPALKKWTPQYFKENFPDKPVQVSYRENIPFAEFIDRVEASTVEKPGPYMYRLFLHENLPEVLKDLYPQNPYAFPRRLASPLMLEYWRRPDGYLKLLIGGVGGGFPVLHFDTENAHATVTEIYGDKEFILFAPEDGPCLYPSPLQANHSRIKDPTSPDLTEFPLAARATCHRVMLHPGDMVFVPCGWWHTARVVTPSISVGMNLLDRSNWDGFVDEVCPKPVPLRPKAMLKSAYFGFLRYAFGLLEGLQTYAPGLARALVFPRWVAPVSSAVAKDPALAPLSIRHPAR